MTICLQFSEASHCNYSLLSDINHYTAGGPGEESEHTVTTGWTSRLAQFSAVAVVGPSARAPLSPLTNGDHSTLCSQGRGWGAASIHTHVEALVLEKQGSKDDTGERMSS